ncbi:hypothetical protein DFJ73DRAFT_222285 [Zopfochytrium polystomum]|nr:hypothetical protein DFJ73DRAFT_222285 [Zopfochytrium polystomum]
MPVSEYVGLVTREKARLVPNPELYPEVSVSLDSLQRRSANALDLVRLLAHLDPDKTFVDSFRSSLEEMKKFRLASIALVGAKWPSLESFDFELQAMARLQLITYDGFAISMHRCIQAVILEQNAVPTAKSERFKKAYAQKVEANFSVIRALKGNDLAKLQGVVQHLSELSLAAHTLAFQRGDKGVFMLAGALRDNSTLKILDLSFS